MPGPRVAHLDRSVTIGHDGRPRRRPGAVGHRVREEIVERLPEPERVGLDDQRRSAVLTRRRTAPPRAAAAHAARTRSRGRRARSRIDVDAASATIRSIPRHAATARSARARAGHRSRGPASANRLGDRGEGRSRAPHLVHEHGQPRALRRRGVTPIRSARRASAQSAASRRTGSDASRVPLDRSR